MTCLISDGKNSDGQGWLRRRHQEKEIKDREITVRLPIPKKNDLLETATAFSQAWQRVVRWGLDNWNQIPFTFPLVNDDGPILDKDGKQKFGLTSAHYLANWLSSKVSLSNLPLHSKLGNGARNQAAETLLSQFRLRQTEEEQPRRLTGDVGEVKERSFDRSELAANFNSAVLEVADPETGTERIQELAKLISSSFEPRFIPILFSGPSDFLLSRHNESGRIFVCLPLFSRERGRNRLPPGVVMRNGKRFRLSNKLVPLREGEDIKVPNSGQWEIFPLEHQRKMDNQRNADLMLAMPEVSPRTAELMFKNGRWHFNIVVDMPEAEPIRPKAFLGVHLGFFSLSWALTDKDGRIMREDLYDQSHLKNLVSEAAKQRAYARARMRTDRFPRYRGAMKLEREKVLLKILALAKEYQAAIGIEDVSGVNKSTWSGRTNLLRSHWDFGKDVAFLTYKSVILGLPVTGRGRRRQLFTLSSFRTTFTCSSCWFTNAGKPENQHLVALEDGQIYCGHCNRKQARDSNAARVVATETQKFFTNKRK
ncbi:MAG: hypothetical protein AAB584_02035 [Patescibacteria group bacterium]